MATRRRINIIPRYEGATTPWVGMSVKTLLTLVAGAFAVPVLAVVSIVVAL